ncbi:MAG: PH domain-containing protein [Balneolales bacterium]
MKQQKTYTLRPDWKDQFPFYMLGLALAPVFGTGLLIIYFLKQRQDAIRYIIRDDEITLNEGKRSVRVTLAGVDQVTAHQSRLEKRFGIGRLHLQAEGRGYELRGIARPERIRDLLLVAIETEKARLRQKEKVKGEFPELSAGSVDKVNTLVGLWQQGLIDDEEYERERNKI